MSLPTRLQGHNCEDEIQSIQDALNLVEQHIASIKRKNPDAHLVLDSNTDGLFFVLGTRTVWRDGWNGDYQTVEYCYEDVVHRFDTKGSGEGITASEMEQYKYHQEENSKNK